MSKKYSNSFWVCAWIPDQMSPTGLGWVLTKKNNDITQRKAANPHISEKVNCQGLAHFYHKWLNWRSKLWITFQLTSWLYPTCPAAVNPTRLGLLANQNKRSAEICFTSDSVLISKTDINIITTSSLCLSDSSSVFFQHIYSTTTSSLQSLLTLHHGTYCTLKITEPAY